MVKEEIIDRINSTLRDLTIDCPECEGMEDDQYMYNLLV
jgi:hypothetical protein